MSKINEYYLYIKFDGPAADNGELDIVKAGKALSALGRWKRQYRKEVLGNTQDFDLKLGKIKKNCTELQIIPVIQEIATSSLPLLTAYGAAHLPGVKDFLKRVGDELGNQLMLKVFSKGKNLTESDTYARKDKVYVKAINIDGNSKEVEKKELDFYRKSNQTLNGMYALEPNKETRIRVGYYSTEMGYRNTGIISLDDKSAFVDENNSDDLSQRMSEGFDDDRATSELVQGQFVDFHGLAHRYKFSFQARKDQEKYGKQKILCIVEESKLSEILDLLKPENRKNVCIKGKAIWDQDNKLDKIKVEWFNEDPDYDPDQTTFLGQ